MKNLWNYILDTRFSCSKDTKYFKLIDLYSNNKSFITHIIEEQGMQHKAILDKMDFLDRKYEALVKAIWGMEVVERD
jgi:hypothetical protein